MPLSPQDITAKLADTPGWELADGKVKKQFGFDGFEDAMDFVNHVAERATEHDHHPEVLIEFDKVTITLWTHSEHGVTDKDIALAKAIDVEALP